MPTTEPNDCVRSGGCDAYPEVGLEWTIDDPVEPTEITVTPADPDDPTAEWLSVDPAATVALETVR